MEKLPYFCLNYSYLELPLKFRLIYIFAAFYIQNKEMINDAGQNMYFLLMENKSTSVLQQMQYKI